MARIELASTEDEIEIVAVKVYAPQERAFHVHAQRVTRCPLNFPASYFRYGGSM